MTAGPQSVAFFRNLNLGQRGSPTRPQLLEALRAAGARSATSFMPNGTVVLEAGDPDGVATEAAARLQAVCGYADVALVRPLDWLGALDLDDLPGTAEVSFFDGPDPFPEALPWSPPGAGLVVVEADHLHAVSVNHAERTSGATWALERRLGVPVTSRGVGTIRRLLRRFCLPDP